MKKRRNLNKNELTDRDSWQTPYLTANQRFRLGVMVEQLERMVGLDPDQKEAALMMLRQLKDT